MYTQQYQLSWHIMGSQMQDEIERKFVVEDPPKNYAQFPQKEIDQGYFRHPKSGILTRVRRKGDRYFQTQKKGTGLVREEKEIELNEEEFLTLWPLTSGWRLQKIRYEIPWDGFMVELDVYGPPLSPFISAEVEFDSVEASRTFNPPPWMSKEVTEDVRYTNAHLAKHGLPVNKP